MKGQFQSTEALKIRLPPFVDIDGEEILGTDVCTIVVRKPDTTTTTYNAGSSPAVLWDSTMEMWTLDIPTGSYAAGEWRAKATSNAADTATQRKVFYWGDYVETIASIYARQGAPAGASMSADTAAVKAETASIKAKTDLIPASPASAGDVTSAISSIKGSGTPDIAAVMSRLGAPAGASQAADIAAVKSETASIKAKTDNLPSDPADQSLLITAISAVETKVDTVDTVVDAVKVKTDALPSDPADQSLLIVATDAIYNRIGAPAGASIADDISNVSGGGGGDLTPVQVVVDAIKLKTDNLPSDPADQSLLIAAIGAVETKVDTVDTVVDAVKAKTDNLPANPASQTNLDVAVSTRATASDVTTATSGLATAINLAAAKTVVDAVKLKTDNLPASPAAVSDVTSARDSVKGVSNRDNTQVYDRLGAPAGASLAADIANIDLGDLPSDVATIASKVADLYKERFNRWKVQGTQLLIYEDNGSTIFKVFNMKDDDGLPSSTRVFERVPA